MLNKVRACVEQFHMIAPGDHVVAGVSGGADSVCLLFVLLELKKSIPFGLSVVHVNHGIRQEAGEDALFVEGICREQNIPFFLFEGDVKALAKEKRLSEEEAGREFRYQCFEKVLGVPDRGKIAVAHHREDRAETMLFHLFRGTGLKGLAGIPPVRDRIIRPLLFISRHEIEDFLQNRQAAFRTDATNQEDIYIRNRIRHHILPRAEEINANAVRHMSEAAEYIREAEEYIRKQADRIAGFCVTFSSWGAEIDLPELLRQEPLIQKYILLSVLEGVIPGRRNIGSRHISGLLRLAGWEGTEEMHRPFRSEGISGRYFQGKGTKEITLPGGYLARREYDRVMIWKVSELVPDRRVNRIFPVTGPEGVKAPDIEMGEGNPKILAVNLFPYGENEIIPQKTYTKWFDYDKITTSALFRTRKQGDYLVINHGGNRKSLKQYMIDEKMARGERENKYLLADASHIMWIPGYRISEHYKVSEQTKTVLEIIAAGPKTEEGTGNRGEKKNE